LQAVRTVCYRPGAPRVDNDPPDGAVPGGRRARVAGIPADTVVMRWLRAGHIESSAIPHDATLAVMSTVDTALRQIGVRYPTSGQP